MIKNIFLLMVCHSWIVCAMNFPGAMTDVDMFLKAAETGAFHQFQELLKKNPDLIKSVNQNHETALHLAIWNSHKTIYLLLIKAGADLEARDKDLETPLHLAVSHGEMPAIWYLLNKKAQIEARDQVGHTPLSWAVINGRVKAVQALLDRGAQVEVHDRSGRTPLSWAAGISFEPWGFQIMKALLKKGCQVDVPNREGRTPLSFAGEMGYPQRMDLLIGRGAHSESQDVHGHTPLYYSVLKLSAENLLQWRAKYPDFESKIFELLKENLGFTVHPDARKTACKVLFALGYQGFNPVRLCGIDVNQIIDRKDLVEFASRCKLHDSFEQAMMVQDHLCVNLKRLALVESSSFPGVWINSIKNKIVENLMLSSIQESGISKHGVVIRKIIGQEIGLKEEQVVISEEWWVAIFEKLNVSRSSDWKTYLFVEFLSYYSPQNLIDAFQKTVNAWLKDKEVQSYEKLIELFGQENFDQSYFDADFQFTQDGVKTLLLKHGYLIRV